MPVQSIRESETEQSQFLAVKWHKLTRLNKLINLDFPAWLANYNSGKMPIVESNKIPQTLENRIKQNL